MSSTNRMAVNDRREPVMALLSVEWKLRRLYASKASVDVAMYDVGALLDPWLIP